METRARETNQINLILVNGKIFTADPSQPYVEAVAVGGERIMAVGASEEIAALADSNTRRIDLQGHVAIPGINDAHLHSTDKALGGHCLSFQSQEPSWQETQDALAEAVKHVPAGTWIFGMVGGMVIVEPAATRFALDRIAPDHPVVLIQYASGELFVNTHAMRAFEIAEEEPDPPGGQYDRVPNSRQVNGKIVGYAGYGLSRRLVSRVPDADHIKTLQALAHAAVRYGVTSIQDMPFIAPDQYLRVVQAAHMPIRIRLIRFPLNTVNGRDLAEGRDLPLHPSGLPLLTVRGIKWILDGTPFEWGSALRGTYRDRPDWSGRLNFAESEIAAMVQESLQWQDQLLVHCAGDRPVEVVFDAMEKAQDVDWQAQRVRIEHGDGVASDLIPRARRLGVVVVQNPSHLASVDLNRERYGLDTPFYPLRSLLEAGVRLAFGSDGPLNPYLNIMFAVLHPVHPAEGITREQAVEAYTRGSAFAEFEEHEKGTISQGKLADIAVLSQDIFAVPVDTLPQTESILTLVGGQVVYDARALD